MGITSDGTNLYVVDQDTGTIRKVVISSTAVSTVTGGGGSYLNHVTTDGTNLYVADDQGGWGGHIKKIE